MASVVWGMMVSSGNQMYSDQWSTSSSSPKKLSSLFDTKPPKVQKWSNWAGTWKTNLFKAPKQKSLSSIAWWGAWVNFDMQSFQDGLNDMMNQSSLAAQNDSLNFNPVQNWVFKPTWVSSDGNIWSDIMHTAELQWLPSKIWSAVGTNNPLKAWANIVNAIKNPFATAVNIGMNVAWQYAKTPQAQKIQAQAQQRAATKNWKGATSQELLLAPAGTRIPTRLSQTTNQYGGKECAEWVNDVTGAWLGSSYQSKLAKMNSKQGKIWSVAVWQPSSDPALQKYGHTWIIVGDDGQGNWLIKSSNYKVDGAISVDKVPKGKIDGYRDTNLWQLLTGTNNNPTTAAPQKSWMANITKALTPVQQTAVTSFENNMWPQIWNSNAWSQILQAINKWNFVWAANTIKSFVSGGTPQQIQQRSDEARMLLSQDRTLTWPGSTKQ